MLSTATFVVLAYMWFLRTVLNVQNEILTDLIDIHYVSAI